MTFLTYFIPTMFAHIRRRRQRQLLRKQTTTLPETSDTERSTIYTDDNWCIYLARKEKRPEKRGIRRHTSDEWFEEIAQGGAQYANYARKTEGYQYDNYVTMETAAEYAQYARIYAKAYIDDHYAAKRRTRKPSSPQGQSCKSKHDLDLPPIPKHKYRNKLKPLMIAVSSHSELSLPKVSSGRCPSVSGTRHC